MPDDEVDRIVAAWRRERPQINVSALEVLSRLTRLARYLDRARATTCAHWDLEVWEFDVLSALRRTSAPHELTPGQLVANTLVTSGTMTNRVDRLQQRGLVARRPDPSDGRGIRVSLTPAGRDRIDSAFDALLVHEEQMLAGLSADERQQLARLLRRLGATFESNRTAGPR
ncbi:MAG: MarR family transcriptional regulator [Micrococcales bacterium]|nr:MAG: MarR family transcriptional regulator [Micrococcales bacterium]PIE28164.1 MAG: MarR family transcriptional regulator [Micrococcales bacterium]